MVEIDERVTIETSDEVPTASSLEKGKELSEGYARGKSGDVVKILRKPEESEVRSSLEGLRSQGFKYVCLTIF